MAFENIAVKEVIIPEPKKKPAKPTPPSKWVRVIGGPEGVDIQILIEDCSGRKIFNTSEVIQIAKRFLADNPDPQPIPAMAKKTGSQYVLYTVGEKEIYVFIAWRYGLDIMIMLPQNKQLEPIRTDNSAHIPAFDITNKVEQTS